MQIGLGRIFGTINQFVIFMNTASVQASPQNTKHTFGSISYQLLGFIVRWLILPILLILLLIWALSPTLINWSLNDQLKPLSLQLSESSHIRLNPFLLKLSLSDLQTINLSQQATAKIDFAEIDIGLWGLLDKEIEIEKLALHKVMFVADQNESSLKVAGVDLNHFQSTTPPTPNNSSPNDGSSQKPVKDWLIKTDNITIAELDLVFEHFDQPHKITVKQLDINQLQATSSEQQATMQLSAIINGAPLDLNLHVDAKGEEIKSDYQLNLKTFDLASIYYLLPPTLLNKLGGKLSLSLAHQVTLKPDNITLNQSKLALNIDELDMIGFNTLIQNQQLNINLNNSQAVLNKKQLSFQTDWQLNNQHLSVRQQATSNQLLQLGQLEMLKGHVKLTPAEQFELHLDTINLYDLLVSKLNDKASNTSSKEGVTKNTSNKDSVPNSQPALALVKQIAIRNIDLSNQQLMIDNIDFNSFISHLILNKQKLIANLVPINTSKASTDAKQSSPASQTATNNSVDNSQKRPNGESLQTKTLTQSATADTFTFNVNQFTVSGNNELYFQDQSIQPAFIQHLTIPKLTVGPITNQDINTPTEIDLALKTDAYAGILLKGKVTPFTPKLNLQFTSQLSEFSIPPVSPYLKDNLGFEILSGQLDNQTVLEIVNNKIKGNSKINMRGLKISSSSQTNNNLLKEHTAIPLNSAINMLKDSAGNLELDIPLKGDVSSPDFGISSFISLITKKAVMAAAESYLIDTFVPYANVLSVVRIAGEYMLKIRFENLNYTPAAIEVQPEQEEFITQFVALLKDKPDTQVKVCAIATPKDLPEYTGDKNDAEYQEQLKNISLLRGQQFKAWVVEKGTIKSSRLLLCQPRIDTRKDAQPRIEFEV
ncbi:DUF748 domain-containing protein [Aliikangiella maris]|uniref:DUF748 domain-containing protein n=2 Tax=Aliikangiella maris TaxID=3162458 RepID=A0ABV3MR63_9GAMM